MFLIASVFVFDAISIILISAKASDSMKEEAEKKRQLRDLTRARV